MAEPQPTPLEMRFRDLLRNQYPRLRRIARTYAAAGEHEDLLQDILVQVWRGLPGFDGHSKISTWVYRVALNTALGSLRSRYARPVPHAMPDADLMQLAPTAVGNPVDPDALLGAFLVQLPPIDRAVVMLSLDDLPHAEIADITGLSRNAVAIRLNRIKQRFIDDYVEDSS